eukprot:CAMPEP_0113229628 /NCGR_PEP_ID=MMETSP0008_2-20120614/453_1 /TAXON_ID=97485 /ORGANISM="Prymnesium parvum" /LENGTH=92 /DNA_ID=CAMNT_0000076159 /DNA_START=311 /DNA_END=585 /DNA_ORIENTATION=- /assembly_acc=CAM_ASM_000153
MSRCAQRADQRASPRIFAPHRPPAALRASLDRSAVSCSPEAPLAGGVGAASRCTRSSDSNFSSPAVGMRARALGLGAAGVNASSSCSSAASS